MFINGVFDSTYRIHCVLRKTSIMMMQHLTYLVVCNVTRPRRYPRRYYLPPFHVPASRPSTVCATARSKKQIVISVYNIVLVVVIYVWID
jgi:hypothetical protein